ncbi:MAG: ABC transporter permease [Actinomycetia bacterium]|nr:ABC transporter permease [Actinomycetes bacterium]MCP4960549.1 ABC transporter permease [Actinomycetes bacterium]
MTTSIEIWQAALSWTLIALALGLSSWRGLGIERRLIVASFRAAVQLVAVGYLFLLVFEHEMVEVLAWTWVLVMVAITSLVAHRRAPELPGSWRLTLVTTALTTGISLTVVFGFGVLDYQPVSLVVIAGITIGNILPGVVLAAKSVVDLVTNRPVEIEQMMALGFDRRGVVRFSGREIARNALIPQIERTNVVGLIALPGAMTGLLLAGVEPLDAVLIQLVVMYLVLGATATCVVFIVSAGLWNCFTPDFRLIAH